MKWLLNTESGVEFSESIKQTNIKGFFQYQLIHIGDKDSYFTFITSLSLTPLKM